MIQNAAKAVKKQSLLKYLLEGSEEFRPFKGSEEFRPFNVDEVRFEILA